MAAERLDPPLLFVEVTADLAATAEVVIDGLLEAEGRVQDGRDEDAGCESRPQDRQVG
jgi:hypothetical protein